MAPGPATATAASFSAPPGAADARCTAAAPTAVVLDSPRFQRFGRVGFVSIPTDQITEREMFQFYGFFGNSPLRRFVLREMCGTYFQRERGQHDIIVIDQILPAAFNLSNISRSIKQRGVKMPRP